MEFNFPEEMILGKKHINKISYDKNNYKFIALLNKLFETDDLSLLHTKLENEYEIFREFGKDSETIFHKKFYEYLKTDKGSEIKEEYEKFCKEVIFPYLGLKRALIQKFPTIRFNLPNNIAVARKHIDSEFHPIGEINFSYAYTDMFASNAILIETMPRDENFVRIEMKSGECTSFNANLCTHYNEINKTKKTRVSMDFRVLPLNYYDPTNSRKSATTKQEYVEGGYYKMLEI